MDDEFLVGTIPDLVGCIENDRIIRISKVCVSRTLENLYYVVIIQRGPLLITLRGP